MENKIAKNQWTELDDCYILDIRFKDKIITTIIDKEDYERASKRSWRAVRKKNKYYVESGEFYANNFIYLHKFILNQNYPKGYEIDHKNGNSLDNRKENLRIVTRQENIINTNVRCDSEIGIRGVSKFIPHWCKNELHPVYRYKCDFYYKKLRFMFRDWETLEEAVYCRKCAEDFFNIEVLNRNERAKQFDTLDNETKNFIKMYTESKIQNVLKKNLDKTTKVVV